MFTLYYIMHALTNSKAIASPYVVFYLYREEYRVGLTVRKVEVNGQLMLNDRCWIVYGLRLTVKCIFELLIVKTG